MRATLAFALLLAAPAAAQRGAAPFVVEQTGQGFGSLQEAVNAAGDRDATILIAPGTYGDCARQENGRITFRAVQPGTAIFEGGACEGKATIVADGRGTIVDGIVFRGIRVPDGNGAGIRTQEGDLTVVNSMFLDSQQGILGAQDGAQRIVIDRSTFSGLGLCEADCAHSLYLGNNGSITITNSRFERGQGGHYIKIRGPNVRIVDNSFDDTGGSKTNYMIDLSEGGTGMIAGNTFVQGKNKENWSALIAVSMEDKNFSATGLRIENNDARLTPGDTRRPAFVANSSKQRLALGTNRLGPGIVPYEAR